ncbi:MAG: large-conductance mechanosensitive channel protein MscL [Betaproteobacteria bacterium]|nr:large-conductance mechanosensitive channel protein MscL [Betaproteobacteria bacterium]
MSMLKEFKEFAVKGNVVDLAVGVIIGGAFGKIVSSVVEDVVMPLVGSLLGGLNFAGLAVKVGDASIKYGKFLQTCVDFVIIAAAIFLAVKLINRMKKEELAAPTAPPAPPRQEVLLEEIRDLLKK